MTADVGSVPAGFTTADFAARQARAVTAAAEKGLAGVLVTPGPDLIWLTGYRPTAITERLTLLVLSSDQEPTLLVPRLERPDAEAAPGASALRVTDWPDGVDAYDAASRLIGPQGRYGISDSAWALHLLGLQRALPSTGHPVGRGASAGRPPATRVPGRSPSPWTGPTAHESPAPSGCSPTNSTPHQRDCPATLDPWVTHGRLPARHGSRHERVSAVRDGRRGWCRARAAQAPSSAAGATSISVGASVLLRSQAAPLTSRYQRSARNPLGVQRRPLRHRHAGRERRQVCRLVIRRRIFIGSCAWGKPAGSW